MWTVLLCFFTQVSFSMGDPNFIPAPTDMKERQKSQKPKPPPQEQQDTQKKSTSEKKK
jgi:hypothetical protein